MTINLPLPPSVNKYYRHIVIRKAPRTLISSDGREYRQAVIDSFRLQFPDHKPMTGRLSVFVELFPRDRRKTDVDNYAKPLLDGMTHAGVWLDDSQIDHLTLFRSAIVTGGACTVTVEELEARQ